MNIKLVFLGTLPGNVTLEPRFNWRRGRIELYRYLRKSVSG